MPVKRRSKGDAIILKSSYLSPDTCLETSILQPELLQHHLIQSHLSKEVSIIIYVYAVKLDIGGHIALESKQ